MGLTASQIRQDLNCFGGFGQQGYGYFVEQLQKEIGNILGLSNRYSSILIGAGNLGRAVATHIYFHPIGFELSAILDRDPALIGTKINGITVDDVKNIEKIYQTFHPKTAVLCVPKSAAPELSKVLYNLGIKSYWNFSHYDISLAFPDVIVENVHLSDSLMTLCYRITANNKPSPLDHSESSN